MIGAVIVIARQSLIDVPMNVIALGVFLILWRFKRLPEPVVVAIAAAFGLLVYPFAQH